MSKRPLLTTDEANALIVRAQAGDEAAMAELVVRNKGLVAKHALKWARPDKGRTLDDCMQDGTIGLMRAIRKFDVSRGLRLSTYATHWIKQALRRSHEDESELIRQPTWCWNAGRKPASVASLDAPMRDEAKSKPLGDTIADDRELSDAEPERDSERSRIEAALSELTEREATVLRMRHGLGDDTERTLAEIGASIGVTRERVRQIEAMALAKLRDVMARPPKVRPIVAVASAFSAPAQVSARAETVTVAHVSEPPRVVTENEAAKAERRRLRDEWIAAHKAAHRAYVQRCREEREAAIEAARAERKRLRDVRRAQHAADVERRRLERESRRLPPEQRRTHAILATVTETESAAIDRAAEAAGLSRSAWARRVLAQAADPRHGMMAVS